ncbi:T9SS type A sorting domain-containing protein [bacterium]|nr:T9SS type A sorting domain-containing protein [bacterium]
MEWQKCLGGSDDDWAYSIQWTTDGGFIVAGYTHSNDGDVSGWHEGYDDYGYPTYDYWVVKLNSAGDIEWQKCLGGSDYDVAKPIQQTTDGGFIVAGLSGSNDGDVSGWHEGYDEEDPAADYWVVKLSPEGKITESATLPKKFAVNVSPNPFNSSCEITVPAAAEIEIYNLEGNLVCKPAVGGQKIIWSPEKSISSGIYLIRAVFPNGGTAVKRVVYVK